MSDILYRGMTRPQLVNRIHLECDTSWFCMDASDEVVVQYYREVVEGHSACMKGATRDKMVQDLIKFELTYLLDNPEYINEVSSFFASGGFNSWSDDKILKKHRLDIVEL